MFSAVAVSTDEPSGLRPMSASRLKSRDLAALKASALCSSAKASAATEVAVRILMNEEMLVGQKLGDNER